MRSLALALTGLAPLLAGCVSPLVSKAMDGNVDALQRILAKKPVDQQTKNEALIEALIARHDAAVALLLDNGADPRSKNEIGDDALTIAFKLGDPAAAALLLNHKADWHTALDSFHLANNLDMGQVLVDHQVDPNVKDSTGATLLAYSACDGKNDLVKFWLDHGANPLLAGKACERGHFDPDSIKTVCDDYATALECAHSKGYAQIEALLKAAGAK